MTDFIVSETAVRQLELAAREGPTALRAACALVLAAHGTLDVRDNLHNTLAHHAAEDPEKYPGALDVLMELGAPMQVANKASGEQPMHRAVESGALDSARRLQAYGVDLSARTLGRFGDAGRTALELGLYGGSQERIMASQTNQTALAGSLMERRLKATQALLADPAWAASAPFPDLLRAICQSMSHLSAARGQATRQTIGHLVAACPLPEAERADALETQLAEVGRLGNVHAWQGLLEAGAPRSSAALRDAAEGLIQQAQPQTFLTLAHLWVDAGGRFPALDAPDHPYAVIAPHQAQISSPMAANWGTVLTWLHDQTVAQASAQALTEALASTEAAEAPARNRPRM